MAAPYRTCDSRKGIAERTAPVGADYISARGTGDSHPSLADHTTQGADCKSEK